MSRHFRRWGGLCAHTRKKKDLSGECLNPINDSLVPSPPAKLKVLLTLTKTPENRYLTPTAVRHPAWKLELVPNILWPAVTNQSLTKSIKKLISEPHFKQWKNTDSVLKWFIDISNKKDSWHQEILLIHQWIYFDKCYPICKTVHHHWW